MNRESTTTRLLSLCDDGLGGLESLRICHSLLRFGCGHHCCQLDRFWCGFGGGTNDGRGGARELLRLRVRFGTVLRVRPLLWRGRHDHDGFACLGGHFWRWHDQDDDGGSGSDREFNLAF